MDFDEEAMPVHSENDAVHEVRDVEEEILSEMTRFLSFDDRMSGRLRFQVEASDET